MRGLLGDGMFKKEKVEKDIQGNLRLLLEDLEKERDIIIDIGRSNLCILPSDFFYFAVGALLDVFPEMKKNKEIIGYYDRIKKFEELFLLAFPDSGCDVGCDVTEEEYDIRFNEIKKALLIIREKITEVKKGLDSGKWSK